MLAPAIVDYACTDRYRGAATRALGQIPYEKSRELIPQIIDEMVSSEKLDEYDYRDLVYLTNNLGLQESTAKLMHILGSSSDSAMRSMSKELIELGIGDFTSNNQ
jgi:hypothetical protein